MRYIQTGFVGEGSTDAEFLAPVARQLLEDHLVAHARSNVFVADPVIIKPSGRWGNAPLAVVEEITEEFSYLDLLLYHTDAGGAVRDAYADRVDVVRTRAGVPVVGVVPKREMEAWALADASALCRVLGVKRSSFPAPFDFVPRHVESITDPKRALEDFIKSVPGRNFSTSDPELTLFGALALEIDLDILRRVPQVTRLVTDIAAVAQSQKWLV